MVFHGCLRRADFLSHFYWMKTRGLSFISGITHELTSSHTRGERLCSGQSEAGADFSMSLHILEPGEKVEIWLVALVTWQRGHNSLPSEIWWAGEPARKGRLCGIPESTSPVELHSSWSWVFIPRNRLLVRLATSNCFVRVHCGKLWLMVSDCDGVQRG